MHDRFTAARLGRPLIILALLGGFAAGPSAPAPVAASPAAAAADCGGTFYAAADSTLDEARSDNHLGDLPVLQVGGAAGGEKRSLLRFDLSGGIPGEAHILAAELELLPAGPGNPAALPIEVRAVAAAWEEYSVSWGSQPPLGARYGAPAVAAQQWPARIDVTTLVAGWAHGLPNHGLALLPADGQGGTEFASRESTVTVEPAARLLVRCTAIEEVSGTDGTQADGRQLAGLEQLGGAGLSLWNGAVSTAALDVRVPASVPADGLARARWFLGAHRDALRLSDPDTQLQLDRRTAAPDNSSEALVFRQLHDGVPVLGAALSVQLSGDRVLGVGGRYLPDLPAPVEPRLTAAEAEGIAAALFGDGAARLGDRPRLRDDGTLRPGVGGDTQLRYYSPALVGQEGGQTSLTWRVNVSEAGDLEAVYVDALNGAVRFREGAHAEGLDLDIQTANNDTSSSCWLATSSDDPWFDEHGPVAGANPDADGHNAFNYARQAYDYWLTRFGRDSYDGDGEDIEIYVHVGQNWANAQYNSGCDIFEFGDGFPVKDVVAHEIAHGVTDSTSDLIYANQSGALNESFSDIFAYFLDNGDSTIGEDLPGGALRSLANPPLFSNPDRMSNYVVTNEDNGGVHTNSGIHNKAAFLLVNGGTFNGYTISGIGIPKAEQLFYNVLTVRLWESAQLIDARNAALSEASWQQVLGRFTRSDVCQVQNAYAAVELGIGDKNCDGQPDNTLVDSDNDRVWDDRDNCDFVANPGQNDLDRDGMGDACDGDIDNDDRDNPVDNCDYVANYGQDDWDGDGQGDACDDSDGDTVMDTIDNCRTVPNRDLANHDNDTMGDACDPDDDNDVVADEADNCRITFNPDQEDGDGDGIGDVCDRCQGLASADNEDTDRDGLGNPCDSDDDNDGIPDPQDRCPYEAGLGCLGLTDLFREEVVLSQLHRFPVPNCKCPGDLLTPGALVTIAINLPVGYRARIVDSTGVTVAKDKALAGGQLALRFRPPPYAAPPKRGLHTAAFPDGPPGADEVRYYLELAPAPGVDPEQRLPLALAVSEGVPTDVFLPIVAR